MRILTRPFGFMLERSWRYIPRRWYKLSVAVGLGALGKPNAWYRLSLGCDFWLIPNFIWHEDLLWRDKDGRAITQCRIVGIHNWPFRFWVTRASDTRNRSRTGPAT